ncbi:hypothetical protein D0544_03105 [Aestuariirhabdus litorea]|uniref:Uncharacterized protein n=2 Tax=Aestuariirhabdus litorea TaxID=2528527 RepID=A0A3P3VTP4_9GAMM|nr:transporter substrate-binding domain-containing protein [Aestuariirhabdus litorea]RRJ84123.1 hypothetical protein D0544_03105 [Aestuariirhabdus litorea]
MVADTPMQMIAERVMTQVYERLNLALTPVPLPAKRALQAADSGQVDAELLRVADIVTRYTNLLRVPEPYLMMQAMAFSRAGFPPIRRWEDLKPYRVGVMRGVHYSAQATEGMDRLIANDMEQLFDLLQKGRVDLVVTAKLNGAIEMRQRSGPPLMMHPTPLYEAPMYHFMNRRHGALVDALSREIADLKASGQLQRWVDEAVVETAVELSATRTKAFVQHK